MAPLRVALAALGVASVAAAPYFARRRRLLADSDLYDFSNAEVNTLGSGPFTQALAFPMSIFGQPRSSLTITKQGYVSAPRASRSTPTAWFPSVITAPTDTAVSNAIGLLFPGVVGAVPTFSTTWAVNPNDKWPSIIAGLWSDNDANGGAGSCAVGTCAGRDNNRVYYEYFTTSSMTAGQDSKRSALRSFISAQGGGGAFNARQMLIVTFYKVQPRGSVIAEGNPSNTYQIIIADDIYGNTFVHFQYINIGWGTGGEFVDSNTAVPYNGFAGMDNGVGVSNNAAADALVQIPEAFINFGVFSSLSTTTNGRRLFKIAGPNIADVTICPCYELPVGSAWLTPFAPTPSQTAPQSITQSWTPGYLGGGGQ